MANDDGCTYLYWEYANYVTATTYAVPLLVPFTLGSWGEQSCREIWQDTRAGRRDAYRDQTA